MIPNSKVSFRGSSAGQGDIPPADSNRKTLHPAQPDPSRAIGLVHSARLALKQRRCKPHPSTTSSYHAHVTDHQHHNIPPHPGQSSCQQIQTSNAGPDNRDANLELVSFPPHRQSDKIQHVSGLTNNREMIG